MNWIPLALLVEHAFPVVDVAGVQTGAGTYHGAQSQIGIGDGVEPGPVRGAGAVGISGRGKARPIADHRIGKRKFSSFGLVVLESAESPEYVRHVDAVEGAVYREGAAQGSRKVS